MNRILLFVILSLGCFQAFGQQQSLYSQYIFNLYMVNPAYAGTRDAISVNLGYRAQWVGFEGAPTTQNFSIHSPLRKKNMALGLQFQNDQIGVRTAPMAAITYAYALNLGKGQKLSFGLQGGVINYQMDWNALTYNDRNDPGSYATEPNRWIPNFDFGVMYVASRSYIGLSANSMNTARLTVNDFSDSRLNTYFNLVAGKVFTVSENFALKPSVLVRQALDGPTQFDVNMSALFSNRFWFTTSYRYGFGMVVSAHVYITDKFHVGYAYDWALNSLATYQSGSHEIFIGYDFSLFRKSKQSIRFY